MVATVKELIVWQLSDELRQRVYELCKRESVFLDSRFRNQVQAAAAGVATNVAEGFGRTSHREFLQFLGYARASMLETEDWLRDGVLRGYWTNEEVEESRRTCRRLTAAMGGLRRHLSTRR